MITLLYGTNRLAIEERLQALRAEHDPDAFNTTVIEQASRRLADLRGASLASGFFGATRLVIARDLFVEPGTGRGRRAASASRDEIASLLAEVPPTTLLVIVEGALTPAVLRDIRKAVPDLDMQAFDVPRGRELADWVRARAQSLDATIDARAIDALLEALFPGTWRAVARRDDVPPDLYRLDSEVVKLATAAGPGGQITSELVSELVPGAEAINIWGLTDAIAKGDPAAAVREVERALATGTAAEMLIGQLAGQFEVFAALSAAGPAGIKAAAAETGLTEGRLQQASRSMRGFPAARVRRGLAALRAIDVGTKQGELDATDALVGIIAQLAADR